MDPLFENTSIIIGEDFDRIGTKKDGLKLNWSWGWPGQNDKEPQQICGAKLGHFGFTVVLWHYGYEATLSYGRYSRQEDLIEVPDRMKQEKEDRFTSRLKCQIFAETLLGKFYKEIKKEIIKI